MFRARFDLTQQLDQVFPRQHWWKVLSVPVLGLQCGDALPPADPDVPIYPHDIHIRIPARRQWPGLDDGRHAPNEVGRHRARLLQRGLVDQRKRRDP